VLGAAAENPMIYPDERLRVRVAHPAHRRDVCRCGAPENQDASSGTLLTEPTASWAMEPYRESKAVSGSRTGSSRPGWQLR
jgi:hypothetical protein